MSLKIGISLGNTRNLHDGLGEFSVQLGSRIAAAARHLKEKHAADLFFHLHPSLDGIFGDDVSYIHTTRLQRFVHRQNPSFTIWHKLNQLNKTLPPSGTKNTLITVHDLNFLYFKNGFSQWRDFRKVKRIIQQCDEIITISHYVKSDILKHMQWRKPMQVIYSGARNLSAMPQTPPQAWTDKKFLFHLSRMSPSKNTAAILKLAESWPDMNFVLAGTSNRDIDVIKSLIAQRLPNVSVYENITDAEKAWFYAHCEGFLFPSLTEGFGLPPLEAMHFGKPVFLSDRTCLPEIGGSAAWYFDDFSEGSMREVIEKGLSEAPSKIQAIKTHAARFNWDDCARTYLSHYEQLLASPCVSHRVCA